MNFKRVLTCFFITGCFMLCSSFCNGAEKQFEYNFKGWDSNHRRPCIISFNIGADGHVNGTLSVKSFCKEDIELVGGEVTFAGMVTGAYPQSSGSFEGVTISCDDQKTPIKGIMNLGYHLIHCVFIRLISNGNSEEFRFKKTKNPF